MHQSENQYRPGHCNIGQKELAVRKKMLYFFAVVTVALSFSNFVFCNSLLCWFFMLFSAYTLIVLFLEIKYSFCILFGFFSLFNFGPLGNLSEIKNREHVKKDRKRVLQIMMEALLVSMTYSSLIHIAAMKYHF